MELAIIGCDIWLTRSLPLPRLASPASTSAVETDHPHVVFIKVRTRCGVRLPSYVTNARRCQRIPAGRSGARRATCRCHRAAQARCRRRAAEIARSVSRRSCFSRSVCRLSYSFLPLASAISTLARPSLKYSASGTIVWPDLLGLATPACRSRPGAAAACACAAPRGWSRCPGCTPGCGRCAATPRPRRSGRSRRPARRGPGAATSPRCRSARDRTRRCRGCGSRAAPSCSARSACDPVSFSLAIVRPFSHYDAAPRGHSIPSRPAARRPLAAGDREVRGDALAVDAAAGGGAVVADGQLGDRAVRAACWASAPSPCRRSGSRRRRPGRGPGGRR